MFFFVEVLHGDWYSLSAQACTLYSGKERNNGDPPCDTCEDFFFKASFLGLVVLFLLPGGRVSHIV